MLNSSIIVYLCILLFSSVSFKPVVVFFSLMWTIFKVFIEFVTILLLFYVWFFGYEACRILGPGPGIAALKGEVLTTGPPGKSLLQPLDHLFPLSLWNASLSQEYSLSRCLHLLLSDGRFLMISICTVYPFSCSILLLSNFLCLYVSRMFLVNRYTLVLFIFSQSDNHWVPWLFSPFCSYWCVCVCVCVC